MPFDPVRLELRGSAVPVLDDVAANPTYGGGQFDIFTHWNIIDLQGKASTATWQLVWGKDRSYHPPDRQAGDLSHPQVRPTETGSRWMRMIPTAGYVLMGTGTMSRSPSMEGSIRARAGLPMVATCLRVRLGDSPTAISSIVWIRADGGGERRTLFTQKTVEWSRIPSHQTGSISRIQQLSPDVPLTYGRFQSI